MMAETADVRPHGHASRRISSTSNEPAYAMISDLLGADGSPPAALPLQGSSSEDEADDAPTTPLTPPLRRRVAEKGGKGAPGASPKGSRSRSSNGRSRKRLTSRLTGGLSAMVSALSPRRSRGGRPASADSLRARSASPLPFDAARYALVDSDQQDEPHYATAGPARGSVDEDLRPSTADGRLRTATAGGTLAR